jgi:hypothetical protein
MNVGRTSVAVLARRLAVGEAAAQYEKALRLEWLQRELREGAGS